MIVIMRLKSRKIWVSVRLINIELILKGDGNFIKFYLLQHRCETTVQTAN
jgi:hypothetical protein